MNHPVSPQKRWKFIDKFMMAMAVSENGYTPSYGYPTKVIKSHDQPMDEMKQCPAMSSNAIAVGNRPSHGRCRGRYRRG